MTNAFGVPGFWVPRGLLDDYRIVAGVELPALRTGLAKQTALVYEQEKLIFALRARESAMARVTDDVARLASIHQEENESLSDLRDAVAKQARATRTWQMIAAASAAAIVAVIFVQ